MQRLLGREPDEAEVEGSENDDDTPEPVSTQASEPAVRETIRRVSTEIEAMPLEQRRLVAGYAYVLARIALADHDVQEAELKSMERALIDVSHLSVAQAALVVEVARTMAMLYGATEDFVVTREFAASATREQREDLLRTAFMVGAADKAISAVESRELDEIGKELGFLGHEVEAIRESLRTES